MEVDNQNSFGQGNGLNRTRSQRKAFRQLQFAVTAGTVFLCCVGVLGLICHSQNLEQQGFNKLQLLPTLGYFDSNQDAAPLQTLQFFEMDTPCVLPAVDMSIMDYPATVQGCYYNGKVRRGRCHSSSGTPVSSTSGVQLNNWREGKFCSTPYNMALESTHTYKNNLTVTEKCPLNQISTSDCDCFVGTAATATAAATLPLTGFAIQDQSVQIPTGAGWVPQDDATAPTQIILQQYPVEPNAADQKSYIAIRQNIVGAPYVIGLDVTKFGPVCMNPNAFAKEGNFGYPLFNQDYLGCGTFGEDTASTQADHTSTYVFGVNNMQTLTPDRTTQLAGFVDASQQEELGLYLNTRLQVQTKCNLQCREFRFGTPAARTVRTYQKLWATIGLLGFCSLFFGLGGLLAVIVFWVQRSGDGKKAEKMVLLWTVFFLVMWCAMTWNYFNLVWSFFILALVALVLKFRTRHTTQSQLLFAYLWCCVGLACILYLVWTTTVLNSRATADRSYFVQAQRSNCILDASWAKVLAGFNKYLNMANVSDNLWYLFIFGASLLFVFAVFLYYIMSRLGRRGQRQYGQM